jgi:hypothetical protein
MHTSQQDGTGANRKDFIKFNIVPASVINSNRSFESGRIFAKKEA